MFLIRTTVFLFHTILCCSQEQPLSVKTHNPGNPGNPVILKILVQTKSEIFNIG